VILILDLSGNQYRKLVFSLLSFTAHAEQHGRRKLTPPSRSSPIIPRGRFPNRSIDINAGCINRRTGPEGGLRLVFLKTAPFFSALRQFVPVARLIFHKIPRSTTSIKSRSFVGAERASMAPTRFFSSFFSFFPRRRPSFPHAVVAHN